MNNTKTLTAALTMCSAALSSAQVPKDLQKPMNVLFVIIDDLRPSLGCYGDPYAITPSIDSLAAEATLYSRAYCQQALSGPSRASFLTGTRPDSNGVTELNTWMRKKNPEIVTIPQAFRQNGYRTISVGKTFHGEKNTLDSLSWTDAPVLFGYRKTDEYIQEENKTGGKASSVEIYADNREDDCLDARIRNEAVDRLKTLAEGETPFFLAVGFHKPHLPFSFPERFGHLYDEVSFAAIDTSWIVGAPEIARHSSDELRGYRDIGKSSIPLQTHSELKKAYYSCISFADWNVGCLVSALKEYGLYENTVIILVGDHGYHTGEQGLWCKSTNYESACHSPLIIRIPGAEEGRTVGSPVELIDIFPTLTDVCGIVAPHGLEGKSLVATTGESVSRFAVSQFPRPYPALHNAKDRTHMGYTLRDARWRYVEWYDNSKVRTDRELYDLGDGLLETENVAGRYSSVADSLSSVLKRFVPHTPAEKSSVLRYVSADTLTLSGKILPTANPYHRVDTCFYRGFGPTENFQVRCASGIAVFFKTNSTRISLKPQYGEYRRSTVTSDLAQLGFDLYIKRDGEWVFAASGIRSTVNDGEPINLISGMNAEEKECMLNMPMYSELLSLEIGVDSESVISAAEIPFKGRVAMYGSSYTQGACISRPGMALPLLLTRLTGYQFLSLGCGGNCKMQPQFINVLRDVKADAFVFDCFSNPNAEMILERTPGFVKAMHEAHPDVPLIFISTVYREGRNFSQDKEESEKGKMEAARQVMREATRLYDNVYFIEREDLAGNGHDASVDGVHPSDIGYVNWAEKISRPLGRIISRSIRK